MLTTEPANDLPRAGSGDPGRPDPERRSGRARTCVGCGAQIVMGQVEAGQGEEATVRLVLAPSGPSGAGEVAVDAAGGAFGRGAHVHARPDCIEMAAMRGLARSFKGAISVGDAPVSPRALADAIEEAYGRRIAGLLTSARRARGLVVGADLVAQACRAGQARLLVVASDAQAAAQLSEVQTAVKAGRAVVFGDKGTLGQLCGSGDRAVAVLAITEGHLAHAVAMAVQVREACRAVADGAAGRGKRQKKSSGKPSGSTRSGSGLPAAERGE